MVAVATLFGVKGVTDVSRFKVSYSALEHFSISNVLWFLEVIKKETSLLNVLLKKRSTDNERFIYYSNFALYYCVIYLCHLKCLQSLRNPQLFAPS